MIQADPNRIVLVSLSALEKEAILDHSQLVADNILDIISSSPNTEFMVFKDDFERFVIALSQETSLADTEQLQDIFAGLYERLSRQFAKPPSDKPPRPRDLVEELMEEQEFSSLDEFSSALESIQSQHNTTPDPELGNLSPSQVSHLIYTKWEDKDCPIKFNQTLSTDELQSATFFHNCRLFLHRLIEFKDQDTATTKGNLNRKIVKSLFDDMTLDDDFRKSTLSYNKVINEIDVFPLHIIRTVCECADIIHKRAKRFLVAKKYQYLLDDDKTGELYHLLFQTYFTKFNLGYRDRLPELKEIQDTIGYSLYRISQFCNNYGSLEGLLHNIFLPAVLVKIQDTMGPKREWTWAVETRIVRPLEDFGLLESKRKKEKYSYEIVAVRKTPLFDKFMKFEL